MVKKAMEDVVRELGRYPMEAFEFLHQGLDHTVQETHGPLVPAMGELLEWLETQGVDLADLRQLAGKGEIPPEIIEVMEVLGGLEAAMQQLNRHVGGVELCWGLRDYALKQWGLLAPVVLRHWGISSTRDFGRMVFALVENGRLQTQAEDQIEDFDGVFDFDAVFEGSYKITLPTRSRTDGEVED